MNAERHRLDNQYTRVCWLHLCSSTASPAGAASLAGRCSASPFPANRPRSAAPPDGLAQEGTHATARVHPAPTMRMPTDNSTVDRHPGGFRLLTVADRHPATDIRLLPKDRQVAALNPKGHQRSQHHAEKPPPRPCVRCALAPANPSDLKGVGSARDIALTLRRRVRRTLSNRHLDHRRLDDDLEKSPNRFSSTPRPTSALCPSYRSR